MSNESPTFFKQLAVRKMAVDMAIPEKTIELVLRHSFDGARKAFHDCGSIEISGFGKFLVSASRVRGERRKNAYQLAKWKREIEDPESTPTTIKNRLLFIKKVESDLEIIKKVTHEI